jgi:hypothetical protein
MRERIANVTSSSRNDSYTVSCHDDTGAWECSCIGWTRHMPRRNCRHIDEARAVVEHGADIRAVTLTSAGVALRTARATRTIEPLRPSSAATPRSVPVLAQPRPQAALATAPAIPPQSATSAPQPADSAPRPTRFQLLEID